MKMNLLLLLAGAAAFTAPTTTRKRTTTKLMAKRVVVVGNGPVGQRLTELLVAEKKEDLEVVSFCEERFSCYNRVQLTKWFEDRDVQSLSMVGDYDAEGVGSFFKEEPTAKVRVNDRAEAIDLEKKVVKSQRGDEVPYDVAVLATGSYPFVPPIPGAKDLEGVFVYRTVDDLENLVAYCADNGVTNAAVIGGGLLGLEAAKAVHDLGLATSILEYAPILLCRQIDEGGHRALAGRVEELGLKVVCDARVAAFEGGDTNKVERVTFTNEGWDPLEVGVVVISAGIRPRDEVAKNSAIATHERGGVLVDDELRTSDRSVFAVGEVALHRGKIYGLVAPGYQQAAVAAKNVVNDLYGSDDDVPALFEGADLSTKLKLLGCDVASFGVASASKDSEQELVWNDPETRVYRKLVVDATAKTLVGGVLVGDAGDYAQLYDIFKAGKPVPAATLLAPPSARTTEAVSEDDAAAEGDPAQQICSCNDVSRGAIVEAIQTFGDKTTYADLKKSTKAGSGCGGCEGSVKTILAAELRKLGAKVDNSLCEHFSHSRPELMALVRTNEDLRSFEDVLAFAGNEGAHDGCEICKPAVASILASLRNDVILADGRNSLQDTNDRSLANMQRGGSYSVVPRCPGGEITPEALIGIGQVAKRFGLYAKITGAQRIDLFGAAKRDLPDIWEALGKYGLESGHAYGKALRTVKSCVGSSWCRYGVQNSVDFAITVENRYKGLRSPHKLKSAVSGCTRECAEASNKDFGMIATEAGYDLYVCGNGGVSPRHGVLLASSVDEDTVLRYLDRFLMYYVLTADRLERTARWFERLGPNDDVRLKALQDVVLFDSLGLNAEFERRMQHVVDTYHDEWQVVVKDPALRAQFKQFANTDEVQDREAMIDFVDVRGQRRPVDWPADGEAQTNWQAPSADVFARSQKSWVSFGPASEFPANVGTPVLYGESQLAIFKTAAGDFFATQNMCPHKQAFVLAQGIVGLAGDAPKVACPLHKKQFALEDGKQLDGDLRVVTFPVREEDGQVQLELPPKTELDAVLSTSLLKVKCNSPVISPITFDNATAVFAR